MGALGSTEPSEPGATGTPPVPSEPGLVALLRREIEASPEGRITFARFMERALTEPGLGYYATSGSRPTRAGDFLTGPELHPFFGRCLGRALASCWAGLGSPEPFMVVEYGAGRGTLARTVAEGLVADGDGLAAALDWRPVDLPDHYQSPVQLERTGAVVANEFLDALPVHRLVVRGSVMREMWVAWTGREFGWVEAELSSSALTASLDASGVALRDGQIVEVRPAVRTWIAEVARYLRRGVVLIVDYGHRPEELYGPRRMAGTLVTYRGHVAGDDPLVAVGRQDITAHVDLGDLRRAALALGFRLVLDRTLARFLVDHGLGELLSDLGRDPATHPQAYADARAAVLRLLDPRHLGGHRVIMFERG